MKKGSGYLVETKSGKKGRTFHSNEKVKDKILVYLCEGENSNTFNEKAVLCDSLNLKIIGFID